MKQIFKLCFVLVICLSLAACAQETPVVNGVEAESPVIRQEEIFASPVTEKQEETQMEEAPAAEEIEVPAEFSGEREETAAEEAEVEVETDAAIESQPSGDADADADSGEGPSEEELRSVLEAYQNWKEQQELQEQPSNDSSSEAEPEYDVPPVINSGGWMVGVPDPVTGLIGRSDEAVQQYIDDFLANYKNTSSFRDLEGEGLQYVDDCLEIIRNDPYSNSSLTTGIEHYLSGFFNEDEFNYWLESWIEIAGPFGSGKIIVQ